MPDLPLLRGDAAHPPGDRGGDDAGRVQVAGRHQAPAARIHAELRPQRHGHRKDRDHGRLGQRTEGRESLDYI